MKTHAIIPVFIPHLGCPNDCVFCNQKKITARAKPPGRDDMTDMIEKYLKTIAGRGIKTVEIAFYGGSFTGIPAELQREYLSTAKSYKDRGLIDKIRLSTRPDYISESVLDDLARYGADIIELGVQSFDEEVLRLSNRGHGRDAVFAASRLIKDHGFELGLQLMIGLPGDTYEKSVRSAREAAEIGPSVARLYPTVIIRDTGLHEMYLRGEYTPFSLEETVEIAKEMYRILTDAGITVIRVGLKSTDLIRENGEIAGGYHPAFRQLVESEIAKEQMEAQLLAVLSGEGFAPPNKGTPPAGEAGLPASEAGLPASEAGLPASEAGLPAGSIEAAFYSSPSSFSNMTGHRKSNRLYFEKKYPHVRFTFHVDSDLPDNVYMIRYPSSFQFMDN